MDYSDIEKFIKIYSVDKVDFYGKKRTLLKIECYQCNKQFYRLQYYIRKTLKSTNKIYCSTTCQFYTRKAVDVVCKQCLKCFKKTQAEIRKYPNHFCSNSCAATFNNKNKNYGIRRSKMEKFVEDMIKNDYPNLEFYCNHKKNIGSELDFYFPELKLAIEINGPCHYKPIYGEVKFEQIKNMDHIKSTECKSKNIYLEIIDVSKDTYFAKTKNLRLQEVRNVLYKTLHNSAFGWKLCILPESS